MTAPFSNLFPADGAEGVLDPQQLAALRRSAIMGAGARMLAQPPAAQGYRPGLLASLGQALGGAQEQWSQQLPQAAQAAMAYHQYQQTLQDREARMKALKDVFGGKPPESIGEWRERLMRVAPQLLGRAGGDQDLAALAQLSPAITGPIPQYEYRSALDNDPKSPTHGQYVYKGFDPRNPTAPEINTHQVAAPTAERLALEALRTQRTGVNTVYEEFDKNIKDHNDAAGSYARVRAELSSGSALSRSGATMALSQLAAPNNAREAQALANAMNHGGAYDGPFSLYENVANMLGKVLTKEGDILSPEAHREILRAAEAIAKIHQAEAERITEAALYRARADGVNLDRRALELRNSWHNPAITGESEPTAKQSGPFRYKKVNGKMVKVYD